MTPPSIPDAKWLIQPGESRVIDIDDIRSLKIGLVGGQVDVVAHDEAFTRVEVHGVTVKDLRIERTGDRLEIDHPQLGWDNFLEVFRNFGSGGPRAEVSVAVPRAVALTLGVVSATGLVAGLANDARLNTVSGDLIVDGIDGDLTLNTVSGGVQARGVRGRVSANTVSGDITASGALTAVSVDTVSGDAVVDASGPISRVAINSVSGDTTLRLDDDLAAKYVARSASARITIDGVRRSSTGPTNWTDTVGELAGSFVDVSLHSVSGSLTVVRRGVEASTPSAEVDA